MGAFGPFSLFLELQLYRTQLDHERWMIDSNSEQLKSLSIWIKLLFTTRTVINPFSSKFDQPKEKTQRC
jgi:hypothetical protein